MPTVEGTCKACGEENILLTSSSLSELCEDCTNSWAMSGMSLKAYIDWANTLPKCDSSTCEGAIRNRERLEKKVAEVYGKECKGFLHKRSCTAGCKNYTHKVVNEKGQHFCRGIRFNSKAVSWLKLVGCATYG